MTRERNCDIIQKIAQDFMGERMDIIGNRSWIVGIIVKNEVMKRTLICLSHGGRFYVALNMIWDCIEFTMIHFTKLAISQGVLGMIPAAC